MTSLWFLGIALAIAVVGSVVVWLATRERQVSVEDSIETFRSEMGAIAPPGNGDERRRGSRRASTAPDQARRR